MAKSENSLHRTARLLDLVPYLMTHQGVAITELAKSFGTSVKEITEDLNTLWMCGLPGYTPLELIDLEFESGFVSISNAETLATPRALDRAEALSIYMGLNLLYSELAESSSPILSQILELQEQLKMLLVTTPQLDFSANLASELRGLILRAIRKRGWLEIVYHSIATDEVNTRSVAPYELTQVGAHEYLQAYCDKAKAVRNFRADRIISVTAIADQIWPQVPPVSDEKKIPFTVQVHSLSRLVKETFPSLVDQDLELSGYSENWIIRTITSLGGEVEVSQPIALRSAIAAHARKALANY